MYIDSSVITVQESGKSTGPCKHVNYGEICDVVSLVRCLNHEKDELHIGL